MHTHSSEIEVKVMEGIGPEISLYEAITLPGQLVLESS